MKAALTLFKEKPDMASTFFVQSFYIFIFFFVITCDKEIFVKILLIMSECSAIIFCFNSLSRFQAVFSFFLSYLSILILLDKFSVHIFLILFYLFLVLEFLIVEYKGFLSLNGIFLVILIAYLYICEEILLWGSALVIQLIFLYLLHFLLLHKGA